MAVPDIILAPSEVLLTVTSSALSIMPLDATISFGYVEAASDLSDSITAGTTVMFNPKEARRFMYGSTIYYIIKEDKISGTEVTPP